MDKYFPERKNQSDPFRFKRVAVNSKSKSDITAYAQRKVDFYNRLSDEHTQKELTNYNLDIQTSRDIMYLIVSVSIAFVSFSVPFFYSNKIVTNRLLYYLGIVTLAYTSVQCLVLLANIHKARSQNNHKHFQLELEYIDNRLYDSQILTARPTAKNYSDFVNRENILYDIYKSHLDDYQSVKTASYPVINYVVHFLVGVGLVLFSLINFTAIFNWVLHLG